MHPCAPTQKHKQTPTDTYIHTYICTHTHAHNQAEAGGEGGTAAQQNIKLVGTRVNGRIRTSSEGSGETNSVKAERCETAAKQPPRVGD